MNPRAILIRAIEADDLPSVGALISENLDLLNAPRERPAVTFARSTGMAELLVQKGADIAAVGQWWAPGFSTRTMAAEVGKLLAGRGAPLTPHAAAGLGMKDLLEAMLASDASAVDAKGGDGCTPLHFARDLETAKLLVEHGAKLDARDEDHDSTPAQWSIGDAPEVSRFLIDQGAIPDIFLAAALGDRELAKRLIARNLGCMAHRIGKAPEFPPIGYEKRGGTIYQWTLAFNSFPHQIALKKGHQELFDFLYEKSDTVTQFLVSCVLARRTEAEALAEHNPGIVASLPDVDKELLARYCWETNTNFDAVKLMLDLGFPIAHPERSHGYTPLHNAAWSGSADLVDLLIARGHPVDIVDPGYSSTPLGYAIHDCVVEKRHPEGEFGRVVKALLDAGSPWDALGFPYGDEQIDAAMRPRLRDRADGAALLGDEAAVRALLGAEPSKEALNQALAGAAKGGHTTLFRQLLDRGASVNAAVSLEQNTPLMYAAMSASHDAAVLLLENGADASAKNVHGTSALHMAIWYGAARKTIELLLRAAPNVGENNHGFTPLTIAKKKGREDVIALLSE
ncbi:MAG TPA: ankyrin repeat domain-containing protein [Bryobacteraceae bacterium]|jgi:ankyrin repeat protein